MVYNTQNYLVFGLCPSSGILDARQYNVSETGSVPFLKSGGKTPAQLGPLERVGIFPHHLRTERDPVSETLCFINSRKPDGGQSKKKTRNFEC
jgi:hypothetical protein